MKVAIVTLLTGQGVEEARTAIAGAGGFLRRAIDKDFKSAPQAD